METYRERSFSFLAPKLWHSLPINLRKEPKFDKLKSQLNTYIISVIIRVNSSALWKASVAKQKHYINVGMLIWQWLHMNTIWHICYDNDIKTFDIHKHQWQYSFMIHNLPLMGQRTESPGKTSVIHTLLTKSTVIVKYRHCHFRHLLSWT